MKKSMFACLVVACCLGAATVNHAQEGQQGEAGMPPMGPPEQMKILEAMNGTYDVKFSYKMDPSSDEWTTEKATAVLSLVAGGGAQQMKFDGQMMGMPFNGIGLNSFDRETGQWQSTWVDSMGARISMYTGDPEEGKIVVTGKDKGMGMTYHSRITTYNITDKGFDWLYEMSMDGETFMETAKATYRKK